MREPGSPAPAPSLRVALMSPAYWPEVRRGTERFTHELATGLLRSGQRPALITSRPGRPGRTLENGLPVLRLWRPPEGPLRGRYESYVTHVPISYLALRAGSYDLAHAMYPTDALAAARWRRRTGRPAVLSYMGIPTGHWLREQRGRFQILARAVRGCDAVVALSRHAADAFQRSLGHEAHVIAPGVDLEAFQPLPARDAHPTIICSAAVDEPRKHVPLLIEAFARVREQLPEARLILSRPRGDGPPADAPGIEWADLDDRGTLARRCARAWVAALPSIDEAFGLVLAEALACGTPVVGYRHGAIPEIIDRPGIGTLFDELSAPALAQALLETLELATDAGTAERCRTRAQDFSTEHCTESYLKLYRDLLARAD